MDDAKAVFEQAKTNGLQGEGFDQIEQRLNTSSIDFKNATHDNIQTLPNILDELSLDQAIKLAKKKLKEGLSEEANRYIKIFLRGFQKQKGFRRDQNTF